MYSVLLVHLMVHLILKPLKVPQQDTGIAFKLLTPSVTVQGLFQRVTLVCGRYLKIIVNELLG